jgi:hypothetical protein
VIFFSAIKAIPSFERIPIAAPAFEIASIAYSTWYKRPSGLNIVVRESYLLDMFKDFHHLIWSTSSIMELCC